MWSSIQAVFLADAVVSISDLRQKNPRRMSIFSSGIGDVSKPFVGQKEEFDVCLV